MFLAGGPRLHEQSCKGTVKGTSIDLHVSIQRVDHHPAIYYEKVKRLGAAVVVFASPQVCMCMDSILSIACYVVATKAACH